MTKRTKRLLALMAAKPKLRRVSGLPPLTYKAKKAGTLTDYRIYGQTSRNLFDGELAQGYYDSTAGSSNDLISSTLRVAGTTFIPVSAGSTMALTYESTITYESTSGATKYLIYYYNNNKELIKVVGWYISGTSFTIPENISFIRIAWGAIEGGSSGYKYITLLISDIFNIMLNTGSTPLPYEPYGESVGDLVTSGEHAGEYKLPVTVEGKNLLQNTATSQTINGVTFTVNADGSVTCDGTATGIAFFTILMTINQGSYIVSGAPAGCNFETPFVTIRLRTPSGGGDVPPFNNNDFGMGVTIISDKNNNNDYVYKIRVPKDYTCNNITFYPMIRKADIADDKYEPYQPPVTTNLYLPEQIRKVGDEAEYIDYGEQKFHRISGADLDVTLPALPTLTGTNVLSVGTEVQPSLVEVTGRIRPVPTGGGE